MKALSEIEKGIKPPLGGEHRPGLEGTLRRVEKFFVRGLAQMFNFITRHVSYTFGVAFVTSFGGMFIAAYIALFLSATVHFENTGTGESFVTLFTALVFLVYIPGYYLHFGVLHRLGVPCFNRGLNFINAYVDRARLKEFSCGEDATALLAAVERLPVENMKAATIYPTLVMVPTVAQEFATGSPYNAVILLAGISSAIFIYVFLTYIAAELLTGDLRRLIKRQCVACDIAFSESFTFSIRKKYLFISFLVLIAMTELALMFFFGSGGTHAAVPVLFVAFSIALVAILLFFYLISIEQSLNEIESAAVDLGKGGKGNLFLAGLDRELIMVSRGLVSAAYEVNEIRQNLERKVDERTAELNRVLGELRERDRKLQMELSIASNVQRGILPPENARFGFIRSASHFRSVGKVGGDYYDFFPMEDGSLAALIADVSGHGMPAALVSAMVKISFTDATRRFISPRDILRAVNDNLLKTVKTEEYLTAFLLVISPDLAVTYSNASHRRVMLARKSGEFEEWDTAGFMVGAVPEANESYEERRGVLGYGDRVLLYTDGLVEARSIEGEQFGEERLRALLLDSADQGLGQAKMRIIEAWERHTRDAAVADDMTFLLLEADAAAVDASRSRSFAERLYANGKPVQAAGEIERILAEEPGDQGLHRLLVKSLLKAGQSESASETLERLIPASARSAEDWYLLAAARFNGGRYRDAITAAEESCRIEPGRKQSLRVWELSLERLGMHDEAERLRERQGVDNLPGRGASRSW
ncbi:MAG: tetratricopeptide repeat protein [Spirochaetes bacterium]|nr:MAG: tetratricopeptide repeat protein [Spirochaetota bacterium]